MTFPGRMMARLVLAVGLAAVTLGYSRCTFVSDTGGTGGTGGTPGIDNGYDTTLELRDTSGVPASSFVMGEPIRFDLEIRNLDSYTKTLQFADAQVFDLYVLEPDTSRVRWRHSEGKVYAQVATQLQFTGNSSHSYSVTWNGVLADGTQLPVGSYRARGVIVAEVFLGDPLRTSDLGSNLVYFTVR